MIELLVVTAIIVVITGVVLVNNSRFGGVVLLENLAYDMALSIRQAQVFGISVARFGTSNFSSGYGVSFDLAHPTAYALFADLSVNGLYDADLSVNGLYDCTTPGAADCELVRATTIGQGFYIQSLCVTPAGGTESCAGTTKLDVLFKRPEPDAWISDSTAGASCTLTPNACAESARIILESPRGNTMSVVVEGNGQVAVQRVK